MKRFLIFLLVFFLLIDIFLALFLLNPSLVKSRANHSVSVVSSQKFKVTLTDASYINRKLNEISFWNEGKVNLFRLSGPKVTVDRLLFEVSDQPQNLGVRLDTEKIEDTLYSYGQQYDPSSKTMTIILQLNPSFLQNVSLSKRYSGVALIAIFDLVQDYPRKSIEDYDKKLKHFMDDFYSDSSDNGFINVVQL